jgi:hyperosmotically inducible protein
MKRSHIISSAFSIVTVALFMSSSLVEASESPDGIEASFRQSYVYKTYLQDQLIWIDARDGVVTLTGTVDEESQRVLAEATMAHLPGVKRVDSRLTTKAEVDASYTDNWTRTKVQLALFFHRHVSLAQTGVSVKNDTVTLTGQASNLAQKELTTRCARSIESVYIVKNEMTIK